MRTSKVIVRGSAEVVRNQRLLEGHHPGTMQERTRNKNTCSMEQAAKGVAILRKLLPDATIFSNPRKPAGRMIKAYRLGHKQAKRVSIALKKSGVPHVHALPEGYKRWDDILLYTPREFLLRSVPATKKKQRTARRCPCCGHVIEQ